jgi:hypothetical protein
MNKETKVEVKKEHNNYEITFRVIQAVFLGITALGISSGLGDYAKFVQSPYSAFSITSFVFGLIGTATTEVMARISKKW